MRKLSAKQIKPKQTHARATITAILILSLASCTTTRIDNPAPRVTPPDPYDENGDLVIKYIPQGETFTAENTDGVFFPYWYYEKIFDYIVDTQAAQKIYNKNDYRTEAKK